MKFQFTILLIIISFLFSCSTNDVAGGSGDDVSNGYIQATCTDTLSKVVSGATVNLIGVYLDDAGDSTSYTFSTQTDIYGVFHFSDVPNGNYVVTVTDSIQNLGAIKTRINVSGDSIIENKALVLRKKIPLKGRIENWSENSNISIIVPGLPNLFSVHDSGFYEIPEMFIGDYDICMISGSTVNYLTISVKNEILDTIYIRDIKFAQNLEMASSIFSFYDQTPGKSYQIIPQYYNPQSEPDWYENHDFSLVDYLQFDESSDSLYKIWHLPMIVGVTDSTRKHYGNDSAAIVTLIKNHMKRASEIFNEANINGKIEFTVDSVYFFTGLVFDELVTVPTEFSLKMIYDGFHNYSTSNTSWGADERVGIYSYSPTETGGMFGEEGLKYLLWCLARSRDCFYLELCDVDSSENLVTGESFYLPDYIMNFNSLSSWSPTNSIILNFNSGKLQPGAHNVYRALPDTFTIRVEDSASTAVQGVSLEIYGYTKIPYTIADTVLYSGTTDSNGRFKIPDEPFLDNTKDDVEFGTLYLKTMTDIDTSYFWFPFYEVIDSCLGIDKNSYEKTIVLP